MRAFLIFTISFWLLRCTHVRDNPYDPGGKEYVLLTAPSNLTAKVISPTTVRLDWTDPNNREEGIQIYRGTDSNNYAIITTLPTGTIFYKDTTCRSFTRYYYKLGVFDKLAENTISTQVTVIHTPFSTPLELPVNPMLSCPFDYKITRVSARTVMLSWNHRVPASINGFAMFRGTSPSSLVLYQTLPGTARYYIDSLPDSGITYYGLRAFDSINLSNTVFDSVSELIAPNNLTVYIYDKKNIRLKWQHTEHSTDSIQIERRINGDQWSEYQAMGPGQLFSIDSVLTSFQTYFYRVFAFSGFIKSSTSNYCSLMVKSIRPPVPGPSTIACYSLNETTGDTLFDTSAKGLHGLLQSANRTLCKFNNGLVFSANSFASINRPIYYSDIEFMIEFWMKPANLMSTTTGYQGILSAIGGPFTFYYFNGCLYTELNHTNGSHDTLKHSYDFLPNKWYHIVLSYISSTAFLFIEDSQRTSRQNSNPLKPLSDTLVLGKAHILGQDRYYTGYLDEVNIKDEVDEYFK